MFAAFEIPLSWTELLERTVKESSGDDVFGLAAQLAYYFFLALFPAVLFILALASFFPLTNLIDDIVGASRPIAPADVLRLLEEQLRRISNADSGGYSLLASSERSGAAPQLTSPIGPDGIDTGLLEDIGERLLGKGFIKTSAMVGRLASTSEGRQGGQEEHEDSGQSGEAIEACCKT